jgi:vitamin B12 transporter
VGAGSYGTREVSAGVAGGTEQLSYSARGGYSQTESFSAQNRKLSTYNADNDLYRNGNFSGNFAWRPAAGHELGGSVLYAESRSMYDSGRSYNNYNNAAQSAWNLYSRNRLTDIWTSTVRFGQSIDDYENFASYAPTGATIKTTQDQFCGSTMCACP